MTILQRWRQTALHNKALVLSSVLMAFGTLFYTGAAIVQLCMFARSSEQASEQTQKLIAAAEINASAARQIAAASDRSAEAAEKFAAAAGLINANVNDAVGKLDTQARASRDLADQAKASIKAQGDIAATEEEPVIAATEAIVANRENDGRISVTVQLRNYGRSPALFVSTRVGVLTRNSPTNVVELTTKRVYPDAPFDKFPAPFMPNGKDAFMTGYTEQVFTQDEAKELLNADGGIIIYLRSEYGDARGRRYRTDMCFIRSANGTLSVCPMNNTFQVLEK